MAKVYARKWHVTNNYGMPLGEISKRSDTTIWHKALHYASSATQDFKSLKEAVEWLEGKS